MKKEDLKSTHTEEQNLENSVSSNSIKDSKESTSSSSKEDLGNLLSEESSKKTNFSENYSKVRKLKKPKLNKKNISFSKSTSKKSIENKELLQREINELKQSYLYLQSEFANFKKTSEKQRLEFLDYSNISFIQDLLTSVLNDFNRALEQPCSHDNFNDFKKGIEMIHQKFLSYLKEKGVQDISPCKGDIFDPHIHEVISTQINKDVPENTILQTIKKGYKLKERLIQAAQVIVSQQDS